jgi:hypothetical protein
MYQRNLDHLLSEWDGASEDDDYDDETGEALTHIYAQPEES